MEGFEAPDDASNAGAAASTPSAQSNASQSKLSSTHVFADMKVEGDRITSPGSQPTATQVENTAPGNPAKMQVQERTDSNNVVDQSARSATPSPLLQAISDPVNKTPEIIRQEDRSNTIQPLQPNDAGNPFTPLDIELKGGPKHTRVPATQEKPAEQQGNLIYHIAYGNPRYAEKDDGPNSYGVRTVSGPLIDIPEKESKNKETKKRKLVKKARKIPDGTSYEIIPAEEDDVSYNKDRPKLEDNVLTRKMAREIVESVLKDPVFVDRMTRRDGDVIGMVPGSLSGTIRNFDNLPGDVYEQINPNYLSEGHEEDCNGLSDRAYGTIKNDLSIPDLKSDLISRKNLIGADHVAVEITIGKNQYVLDWHQRYEPGNPLIFNMRDWISSDDSKGVTYNDFMNGQELP